MGKPAYSVDEIDFDDPDDPELHELLQGGTEEESAPPDDNSDLFDAPAENANISPEGAPAATPEQNRIAQAQYEAEHPNEVPKLREMGFADPNASQSEATPGATPPANGQSLREQGYLAGVTEQIPQGGKSLWQSLLETGEDFARGAGQGFTRKWGDEIASRMVPEVDDGTGIPREYAEGSAQQSMRDQLRRDNRESQERSPWAYMAGEVGGTAPGAIALSPIGASGATSLVGAAGLGGLQGMAEGLVSGAGGSEAIDPMQVANEAAESGLAGGALGVTLPLAGAGLLGLSSQLGDWANSARASVLGTGSNAGKFRTLARERGLDFVESDLGRKMDDLGYTNTIIPQKASDYAERALADRPAIGARIGAAEDEAAAQGAIGSKANIGQGIRDLRAEAAANRGAIGNAQDAAYEEGLQRLGPTRRLVQRGPGGRFQSGPEPKVEMTPRELHQLKNEYEDAGGYVSDDIRKTPEGQRQVANQNMADLARRELYDTMQLATPEVAAAHKTAMDDYGVNRIIENLARDQAARHASRSMASIPRVLGAGFGATIGGAAHGAEGSIAGAALGYKGEQLLHEYGPDAAANMLRLAERGTGATGRGFKALADVPQQGHAMGATASEWMQSHPPPAMAQSSNAPPPAIPPPPPTSQMEQQAQRDQIAHNANGGNLERAARETLKSNPAALGKYAKQFAEAVNGDEGKLGALLDRLGQDPEYRKTVLPRLMQLTQGR